MSYLHCSKLIKYMQNYKFLTLTETTAWDTSFIMKNFQVHGFRQHKTQGNSWRQLVVRQYTGFSQHRSSQSSLWSGEGHTMRQTCTNTQGITGRPQQSGPYLLGENFKRLYRVAHCKEKSSLLYVFSLTVLVWLYVSVCMCVCVCFSGSLANIRGHLGKGRERSGGIIGGRGRRG